jgi:hypothetical protein
MTPSVEVRLRGDLDGWICIVAVSEVIIFESTPGPIDTVIEEATKSLGRVSQKLREALANNTLYSLEDEENTPTEPIRTKKS